MIDRILPCPFCNHIVTSFIDINGMHVVGCESASCRVRCRTLPQASPEKAIEKWNNQSALASERAAREAAEKELDELADRWRKTCDYNSELVIDHVRLAEENRRLREAIIRYDAVRGDNTDDGLIRQSEIRRELLRLAGRKDVPHV